MLQCVNDRELITARNKDAVMPVYIDLSKFWQGKEPTITDAIKKTGLDRRTLSAAKRGYLDRCQIETLFKLLDFASELAGKKLTLEEICKEGDHNDQD